MLRYVACPDPTTDNDHNDTGSKGVYEETDVALVTEGRNHRLSSTATAIPTKLRASGGSTTIGWCPQISDNVTCWPDTPSGEKAIMPCPTHLISDDFVDLFNAGNATRLCFPNGTWDSKADYRPCFDFLEDGNVHNSVIYLIYYVGFSASTVMLILALSLFLYFRNLRCLRNAIHCHLMVTFVIKNFIWLLTGPTMMLIDDAEQEFLVLCQLTTTLLNYMVVTSFFWMLVEGLYLHTAIVWAFWLDKIRMWHYAIIGWGVPAVFVSVWAIMKATTGTGGSSCWLSMKQSSIDYWLIIAPTFAVLVLNLVFLASVVWVLVRKLRATDTPQNCLYKKATKATLILFPLLGVTYLLFVFPPQNHAQIVFEYINTVLQSTQGLFVATFYCFLNVEVQGAIKSRFLRWRDGRQITNNRTRTSIVSFRTFSTAAAVFSCTGTGNAIKMTKSRSSVGDNTTTDFRQPSNVTFNLQNENNDLQSPELATTSDPDDDDAKQRRSRKKKTGSGQFIVEWFSRLSPARVGNSNQKLSSDDVGIADSSPELSDCRSSGSGSRRSTSKLPTLQEDRGDTLMCTMIYNGDCGSSRTDSSIETRKAYADSANAADDGSWKSTRDYDDVTANGGIILTLDDRHQGSAPDWGTSLIGIWLQKDGLAEDVV